MILEAMKMQNEIQAPLSGEIIEINCLSGESIEANMPLIVIEPKDISKN
jgi:biotin carboxyl carrier protein